MRFISVLFHNFFKCLCCFSEKHVWEIFTTSLTHSSHAPRVPRFRQNNNGKVSRCSTAREVSQTDRNFDIEERSELSAWPGCGWLAGYGRTFHFAYISIAICPHAIFVRFCIPIENYPVGGGSRTRHVTPKKNCNCRGNWCVVVSVMADKVLMSGRCSIFSKYYFLGWINSCNVTAQIIINSSRTKRKIFSFIVWKRNSYS